MLYLNLAAVLAHASDRLLVTDPAPKCPALNRLDDICGSLKGKLDSIKSKVDFSGAIDVYGHATAGARSKRTGRELKRNLAKMDTMKNNVKKCLAEWNTANGTNLVLKEEENDFRILKPNEEAILGLEAVKAALGKYTNVASMEMGGTSLQIAYSDDYENANAETMLPYFGGDALEDQLKNRAEGAFCYRREIKGVKWDHGALNWSKCLEVVKNLKLGGFAVAPFHPNTHYVGFGSFLYAFSGVAIDDQIVKKSPAEAIEMLKVTAAKVCDGSVSHMLADVDAFVKEVKVQAEEKMDEKIQDLEAKIDALKAQIEAGSASRILAETDTEPEPTLIHEKTAGLASEYGLKACPNAAWVIRLLEEMLASKRSDTTGTLISVNDKINGIELNWTRGRMETLLREDPALEKAVIIDIGSTKTKVDVYSKQDDGSFNFVQGKKIYVNGQKCEDKGWFTLKN